MNKGIQAIKLIAQKNTPNQNAHGTLKFIAIVGVKYAFNTAPI